MNSSSLDISIPILTEVIPAPTSPPASPATPATTTAASASPPAVSSHVTADEKALDLESRLAPKSVLQAQLIPIPGSRLSNLEWDRMEANLRERVLADLMSRIDELLAERLRNSIADVMQLVAESMAEDIHDSLRASLREVVARSVAQEIRRARAAEN